MAGVASTQSEAQRLWSGLLELVRDLIEYAYRSYLQKSATKNGH
jgi:hypothetical protein